MLPSIDRPGYLRQWPPTPTHTFSFLPVNSYSPYNTSYQPYLLDRIGPKGNICQGNNLISVYIEREEYSIRAYILRTSSSDKAPVCRVCVSLSVYVYLLPTMRRRLENESRRNAMHDMLTCMYVHVHPTKAPVCPVATVRQRPKSEIALCIG
jgi:hypothetical protein